MLILTRRIGEKLVIGDNVTVSIVGISGKQVQVGIEAPRNVTINREEIHERIKKDRERLYGPQVRAISSPVAG